MAVVLCLLIVSGGRNLLAAPVAMGQKQEYMRWSSQNDRQLLERGNRFLEVSNRPDSALICFTIVANHCADDSERSRRMFGAQALMGQCKVYFHTMFDYSKAIASLARAEKILRECGGDLTEVHLLYGIMYETIGEQCDVPKYYAKAYDSYMQAFDAAVRPGAKTASE